MSECCAQEGPYRVVTRMDEVLARSPELVNNLDGLMRLLHSEAKKRKFTRTDVLMGTGLKFAGGRYSPQEILDALRREWPRFGR